MHTDKRRFFRLRITNYELRIFSFCVAASLWLILFSACQKNENPDLSSFDIFAPSDQTQEAVDLIAEANDDLKKIKQIYKANEQRLAELKSAMSNKEIEKVRKISDDLVYQINDGMALGESAVSKIAKAEEMNINERFKEYLRLKEESLRKQLQAFEFRRQAGIILRDGFGTKDPKQIEKAKFEFKEKEENFQKYMEAARELSQQANQLAKESLNQ